MNKIYLKKFMQKVIELLNNIEVLSALEDDLGCVDGKIIGTGRSDYTQESTVYNLDVKGKKFGLIDVPGIEGDESNFEEIIKDSLEQAHTIFYINGSGKKIEQATLEKIKKYMRDGTSVYALFNVHCKAKKERIVGIDKTYADELKESYEKQSEIVNQTEKELKLFLKENFKGSIVLNGLLSFCSVAMLEDGTTTIISDDKKGLRNEQKKYLCEYKQNVELMVKDSNIDLIKHIIENKVCSFEKDIYDENIKKLRNRLDKMINKIKEIRDIEIKKINRFINLYNEFESNCFNAKEDFIHSMRHVAFSTVSEAYEPLREELFEIIEQKKGKIKSEDVRTCFERKKDDIINHVERGINDKIIYAQTEFKEAIEEAQQRLVKDYERESINFEVSLTGVDMVLDDSFINMFKYNIGDFGGDVLKTGGYMFSFASVGFAFGAGVGAIIGAAIGLIAGVIDGIFSFFMSEEKRVNKAKSKLSGELNNQIDEVSDKINEEIKKTDYEEKINTCYEQINSRTKKQKNSLLRIEPLLNKVIDDLKIRYRNI